MGEERRIELAALEHARHLGHDQALHGAQGAVLAAEFHVGGMAELVGNPWSVASAFQFGLPNRGDIRYKAELEPMGAIGDAGWYNMRAAVEYLPPDVELDTVSSHLRRDAETGAAAGGEGLRRHNCMDTARIDQAVAELADEAKIKCQGYITSCYGSLTSFNVLFAEDEDRFRGEKGVKS